MQPAYNCQTTTDLLEESLVLWRGASGNFPPLGRRYSKTEQLEREAWFDECLDSIRAASFQIPETEAERTAVRVSISSSLAEIAVSAIDLRDPYVETLLRDGFPSIGADLARCARSVDSGVSAADIFQASRNAWTTCGLQLLLGRTMELTPAIFAYSMLYPYSDNYLDGTGVPLEEKLEFSVRFGIRLAGSALQPKNELEAAVWQFIETIESQYARARYPKVYASLLGIHRAQEQSMLQLRSHAWPDDANDGFDIATLSFAKGGSSVLADAYLAAGSLTEPEIRFAFEWGVLLQLGDDLQDLQQDRDRGSLTLITQEAGRQPLDLLTNRILNFADAVMARLDNFATCRDLVKELLKRSSRWLLVRAAAQAGEFYTRKYLSELETYSPVRFGFLKARQEQFMRQQAWFAMLFEALLLPEETSSLAEEPGFTAS